MRPTLKSSICCVTAFLTLFGMVWAGNEYLAKQKDLTNLEESFAAWKLEDRANAIQKRIWFLEDRYGCPSCPYHKDEYRQLIYELKAIQEKLKGYYQKKGKG